MATPKTGKPRGAPRKREEEKVVRQSLKLTLDPETVGQLRAIAAKWGGIGPHLPLAAVAKSLIELGLKVELGVRKAAVIEAEAKA